MNRIHQIYRTYISLARGEHFTPSEIGECLYDGDCPESILAQVNWFENTELRKEICKVGKMTDQQFFERGIILKPSTIQNLLYSSELRKVFGELNVDGFDRRGIFTLPPGRGFFVPARENGLITSLKFYGMNVLKPKEVV